MGVSPHTLEQLKCLRETTFPKWEFAGWVQRHEMPAHPAWGWADQTCQMGNGRGSGGREQQLCRLCEIAFVSALISYRFRESPTKLLLFWTPGSGDIIQLLSTTSVRTGHLGELSCPSWLTEPPSPNPVLLDKADIPTRQRAAAGSGEAGWCCPGDLIISDCAWTWPVGSIGRVLWQSYRII